MKKVVKSLFSLCILLLSGYIQQDEYSFYESIESSLVKEVDCFTPKIIYHSVINPVLSSKKEENEQNHITDIEERENEVGSFKKYLSVNNNIVALFYTQIAKYFFQYSKSHLFFFSRFSYYPSYKSLYLIFEVMRI